jgi:hypothetical protein
MHPANELVTTLRALIALESAAIDAYEAAITDVDLVSVVNQLAVFRADHAGHLIDLQLMLRTLDQPVSERTPVPERAGSVTQAPCASGAIEALRALRPGIAERLSAYRLALATPLPPPIARRLADHLEDEELHLWYVERTLGELGSAATAWRDDLRGS